MTSPWSCPPCPRQAEAQARPPAATREPPSNSPVGQQLGGRPSSSGALLWLLVCELLVDDSSAIPSALPLVMSQGRVGTLGLPGGQGIAAKSDLQTKPSVKEIPEKTSAALDCFLEFMTLSCSASSRGAPRTPTLSHTRTLPYVAPWGKWA